MSLKAGDWYQNPLSVARRVSAALGMQGRAVYDALCSYVDNDTGETVATPETIADEFQMSVEHSRRIIRDLRKIRAVILITRGEETFYRVNREHPEALVIVEERCERRCTRRSRVHTAVTGARAPMPVACTDDRRNKEELDLTAKPEITNPQVLHTSSRGDFAADSRAPFLLDCIKAHFLRANGYELPPAHEFTLSGAVFDSLLNLPLPYWSNDKLADAVANFFASQRSKTQDPMSPPAKWVGGLYRYRDGPLDVYGKAMEFSDPQEPHGTAGIEIIGQTGAKLNAYQLRTANNLRAAAGAFRYFDSIEQAEGDRGGTDEAGRAHPREPG